MNVLKTSDKSHNGVMDRGAWDKVGSVVGGPEDDDTVGVPSKWHNGRQYDFLVDVDFEDGVPPKKLAFDRTDNPYDVAERSEYQTLCMLLSRHHRSVVAPGADRVLESLGRCWKKVGAERFGASTGSW
jgi:hypothetical protein